MPIPRRSFLKSAAAAASVGSLHDLVAQSIARPATGEVHLVGAGQDRFGETRLMGFSRLNFKVGSSETDGGLFIVENANLSPGGGPPLHYHLSQDEWFCVTKGRVGIQVGNRRLELSAGESVLAPRRISHTWSALTEGSTLLGVFSPAGKVEQFFRDVAGHPELQANAEFVSRYEMQLVGPSPFWKS
jgi:quercetin dioxygenase-like cupin family protein